jgi:hypothetical protein
VVLSTMILVGKSVPLNPDRSSSSRANHSANSSSRGSLEFNLFLDHTAGNNEEDESSSLYGSLPDDNDDALSSSVVPSSALRKKNHHHHSHSHSSSVDRYNPNGSSKSYSVKAMNRSDLDNNKKYSKYQLQVGSSDRIITDSLTSTDADGSIVSASSSSMLIFNDSQSLEPLSNSMMVDTTVTATEGTSTLHLYVYLYHIKSHIPLLIFTQQRLYQQRRRQLGREAMIAGTGIIFILLHLISLYTHMYPFTLYHPITIYHIYHHTYIHLSHVF